MAGAAEWEVRPMFELAGEISKTTLDELARVLRSGSTVGLAVPVIEDRGTGLSFGAHLTIRAESPAEALRLALEVFERAVMAVGIDAGAFREATVGDAAKDLRA